MTIHKLTFDGALGAPIAARLELPDGEPTAFALFAHCFTCGKESAAAVRVSRALVARGIAVLRFDFTGLGESGGKFADTSFSTNVADLVAAADFLRGRYGAPQLLIGHSLGGAAVIAAAHRIGEVRAVATIGAPSEAKHVAHHLEAQRATIEEAGQAEVSLAGRAFTFRRHFIEDLDLHDQAERIASLRRPLLVLHSPTDTVVGIENASQIFLRAKHPKSFVALDGADHLLTHAADAHFAAAMIAAWATRYLPAKEQRSQQSDEGVVAEATGIGRFQQQIRAGRHTFYADEPIDAGGDDSGPSPYALLAAGRAACTSMTVGLYAARKNWPLHNISVHVRHERIHAHDCANCDTEALAPERFRAELRLTGELTGDQRAELLEIANRCPVHRTLSNAAAVDTALIGSVGS